MYYDASERPEEVWAEHSDDSCRWRQTGSEVKVIALKVVPPAPSIECSLAPDALLLLMLVVSVSVAEGFLATATLVSPLYKNAQAQAPDSGVCKRSARPKSESYVTIRQPVIGRAGRPAGAPPSSWRAAWLQSERTRPAGVALRLQVPRELPPSQLEVTIEPYSICGAPLPHPPPPGHHTHALSLHACPFASSPAGACQPACYVEYCYWYDDRGHIDDRLPSRIIRGLRSSSWEG